MAKQKLQKEKDTAEMISLAKGETDSPVKRTDDKPADETRKQK